MIENKYIKAFREAVAELDEDKYDPDEPFVKNYSIKTIADKISSPKHLIRTAYNMKYNNLDKFYPSTKMEDILYSGNDTMKFDLANAFISKLDDFERQKLPYKKEEYVPYVMKLFKAI